MNKNNFEESKKASADVNSSASGAKLQSSNESTGFTVGSIKVQSNEQSIAAKDANLSKLTSNIEYGSPEEVKKFNERTAYIKDND